MSQVVTIGGVRLYSVGEAPLQAYRHHKSTVLPLEIPEALVGTELN